jgi:hypothetical protein
MNTCKHCGRDVALVDGAWIDPEATGEDVIWRETCDAQETFTAEHEPLTEHLFIVRVSGCDYEQAQQVMGERLGPDEDYGFPYSCDYWQSA